MKTLLLLFAFPTFAFASPEKYYQHQWCENKGITEYVLQDRTRVDCLTETHAVEFDHGEKWAEAIGQSLYYSSQTDRKPMVILILENPTDRKYWTRLKATIKHHKLPIAIKSVGPWRVKK